MKPRNLFAVLILVLAANQAGAEAYDTQFSLSLDATGFDAFSTNAPSGSTIGIGASVFGDWRPVPLFSFGTGLDFTEYPQGAGWQTASWNLGGRIFPVPSDKGGEFYLQGEVGINLITENQGFHFPGNGHMSAGLGYRIFMMPGNALDFGAQYDLFSPLSDPLSAVGIKVGWTFLFGPTPIKDKEAASSK